ncbi:tetratricopeptide repeat protein [Albidovulum sp.]|uniref:tetratricopeptide repeat protein n=1 Tax=Albidovulum sp. TaxID=1872424 RepID=UPI003527A010
MLALALTALAGCDSAEERAEKYYQSGMHYLEAGDIDRALVEFRNVFKLNGEHKEARRAYAEAERGRGNLREAFAQYLRLVEQYPDDLPALTALAEIGIESGDYATAGGYADKALERAPGMLRLAALRAVADYGVARTKSDTAAQVAAIARIKELRKALPDNIYLRRMAIEDLLQAQDYKAALTELNEAIALSPDNADLHAQRLSVLAALGDNAGVESGLLEMIARFPQIADLNDALVRWYTSQDQPEKAEAFLRERTRTVENETQAIFDLVRFVSNERGPAAAMAELDRLIADGNDAPEIIAARAGYLFDLGQQGEAIRQMSDILKDAPDTDGSRKIKISLARMVAATGNEKRARELVEEVLKSDQGNDDALKLKGNWLIEDDSVSEAISVLRRALDHDPRDAETMTLMAKAYERDGKRDLEREMLSLAVEATNRAPAESLRYATFLASENKLVPAERVLIDSLRLAPGNTLLLTRLGQLYLQMQDWARAGGVARQLESSDDQTALGVAAQLRAASLTGQQKSDEAVSYLQGLVSAGKADLAAKVAILEAHVANGRVDKALAYASQLLADDPGNPDLRYVNASLQALAGQSTEAEATFRSLVKEDAARVPVWLSLINLVGADPARAGEVGPLIDAALAADPGSAAILWVKASYLEHNGDSEAAIAIYERLYAENSGNPVIANNLASLLATARHDSVSLRRAEVIARRLQGSNVGAYQDTYGWIAYRLGNMDEAVRELAGAAEAMPDAAAVQYHYALALIGSNDEARALSRLRRAVELAGSDDSASFLADARSAIATLEKEGVVAAD